jgi:hypothetical protein
MPFLNRVQQLVTTTGTGASITLGAVYAANANTMATAGGINAKTYSYVLTEGNNFELQSQQTYNSGAGTMTRGTPALSLVGGTYGTSQIPLAGGAVMAVELLAEDLAGFLTAAGGSLTGALNWASAATIASAGTTAIGAAASNYAVISGTTTITAFDTIAQGAFRWVRFSGALTLTYNATSLILPGLANITTAAGDIALFISEGSGNWRMLDYQRQDGTLLNVASTAQWLANTAGKSLQTDQVWAAGTPLALVSQADATVTMTIASPGVVTDTAHGLVGNEPIHFATTGALPTGVTANTEYYVLAAGLTTNTYQFAATRGGTAIVTTGSQSGTHTRVRRVLIDGSLSQVFTLTLARNITLAKSYNIKSGQGVVSTFTQPSSGGPYTITYPNLVAGGYGVLGGTALVASTAANALDDYYIQGVGTTARLSTVKGVA